MPREPKHVYEMEIEAPAERVWEALTDPALVEQWNVDWTFSHQELKPGAKYEYRDLNGDPVIVGEIIEVDPPRRLVTSSSHQWSPEARAEKPSRVTYEIAPTPGGCRLTVVHDGFENEDSVVYNAVGGGWPAILDSLKALVEGDREALASAIARQR